MNHLFDKIKNNPDLIKTLLSYEREDLEYKEKFWWENNNKNWYIECAKDIASMSNSGGGVIIIGIKDNKNKKEIIGLSESEIDFEKIDENLARVRSNNLEPKLKIEMERISVDNKNLVVIGVPDYKIYGPISVINTDKNRILEFYIKRGSHKKEMVYKELEIMFFELFRGSLYRKRFLEEQLNEIENSVNPKPLFVLQAIPYFFDEDKELLSDEEIIQKIDNFQLFFKDVILKDIGWYENEVYLKSKKVLDGRDDHNDLRVVYPKIDYNPTTFGIIIFFVKNDQIYKNISLEIHKNGYIEGVFGEPMPIFINKNELSVFLDLQVTEYILKICLGLIKFFYEKNLDKFYIYLTILPSNKKIGITLNEERWFISKLPLQIQKFLRANMLVSINDNLNIIFNTLRKKIDNMFGV